MSAQYAFVFDASFCSGCKACQAACKDKNNLPVGVLWRRVYEVSGGEWTRQGQAWTSTVFGYNLSLACNHCVHPKCAGVCPVDAYTVRPDGIVLLDSSKCIGCGYCAWACPYAAPQFDPSTGTMGKCNFCFDNLDAGLPPACTAACPMRVLEFTDINAEQPVPAGHIPLWQIPAAWHPFPLPNFSRTEPHLALKAHPAMSRFDEKSVANREEVKPLARTGGEELPLVVFTLLAQMAVGGFWALLWLFLPLGYAAWRLLPNLVIGACLGLGLLASFAHLGRKRNAWRAVLHIRKSWISRELLFTLLFGAGWLANLLAGDKVPQLPWLTAFIGACLVYSMGQVYRLRAVPAWNSWRTNAGFLLSALLLGTLLMAACLSFESGRTGLQVRQWNRIGFEVLALLFIQGLIKIRSNGYEKAARLWRLLMSISLLAAFFVFLLPVVSAWPAAVLVLLLVLAAESIDRWLFYEARQPA